MTDDELYIQLINDIIDGEIDLDNEDYDTRRTRKRVGRGSRAVAYAWFV